MPFTKFDNKRLKIFLVFLSIFLLLLPAFLNFLFSFEGVQNAFFYLFEKILHRIPDKESWLEYFSESAAKKFLKKPYLPFEICSKFTAAFLIATQIFNCSQKPELSRKSAFSLRELLPTALLAGLAFVIFYTFFIQIDFNKMGGALYWCPAHTLITVNDWLEQGAMNLKFISYRSFASIELDTQLSRGPYITYPNGQFVIVWIFAKLFGFHEIGISFVKHFMLALFCLDSIIFASFVYIFATKNNFGKKPELIFASVSTIILWFSLPINSWYLTNIAVSDQIVIFFVMIFLFCEYADRADIFSGKLIKTIKSISIFLGVSTDYYFCFIAFFAFLFYFISDCIERKKFSKIIINSLWYIVPVFVAIFLYILEFTSVDKWLPILKFQFFYRTGAIESEWSGINVLRYIAGSFKFGFNGLLWYGFFAILLFSAALFFIIKKARFKSIFCNANYSIPLIILLASLTQISVFSNHSAMHEFSMVKCGLVIILFFLVSPVLASKILPQLNYSVKVGSYSFSPIFRNFVILLYIFILIIRIPVSTKKYYKVRSVPEDFTAEKIIRENTDFYDVLFSFNYPITILPPQKLSVSKKLVYKIDNISEMETMFKNLNSEARKKFFIKKNEITPQQAAQIEQLRKISSVVYENEEYLLLRIEN